MSILNTAEAGKFSSDCTIAENAEDIRGLCLSVFNYKVKNLLTAKPPEQMSPLSNIGFFN